MGHSGNVEGNIYVIYMIYYIYDILYIWYIIYMIIQMNKISTIAVKSRGTAHQMEERIWIEKNF